MKFDRVKMSDRVEFKKGVGTAVMGDLHEAPRLSNVVTLHVGDQQKEVELITDFQRQSIAQQIAELVELTGQGKMTFYKKFIRDYGLRRFKELPRQHFQDVNLKLEQWISEAKAGDSSTPAKVLPLLEPAQPEQPKQPLPQPRPYPISEPCMACIEKSESFARLQRSNRIQLLALTACVSLCGWLLYKAQAPLTDGQQAAADQKCFIAGNAYSVGYISREKGRAMECAQPAMGMPAVWREVGRTR